ncbi:MAG: ATP-binding protein [Armatimonadota bacterium]
MEREREEGTPATHFAPAERATRAELGEARERFLADRIASVVLEGIPDPVLVVNAQRQIIACNSVFIGLTGAAGPGELLGLRPGEAAHCVHCHDAAGGCGTGESCEHCGAVNAVVDSLRTQGVVSRECRLLTEGEGDGGAMDLLVRASFVRVGGHELVVVALRDISAEKRRKLLERVFFHDVMNTVSGIRGLALLLGEESQSEEEAEYKRELRRLTDQIAEEIAAQRELLAAERGELQVTPARVAVGELVAAVAESYRHHNVGIGRVVDVGPVPETEIATEAALVRRVLGNLLKNALEATDEGGTVTLWAEDRGDEVALLVHNPGVMPEQVQRQVFQRSFSTKGGDGRGIGTHSVRLFVEAYLGGRVGFTSTEKEGTVFTVSLPMEWKG